MSQPDFSSYRSEQRITPHDTVLYLSLFVGESFPNFMVLNQISKAFGLKYDPSLSSDWYQKKVDTLLASAPVQDLLAEIPSSLKTTRMNGVYTSGYAIELAFTGTPDDLIRIVEIGRRVVHETFKKPTRQAMYHRFDATHVDVMFR